MGEYADEALRQAEDGDFGLARLFGAGIPMGPSRFKNIRYAPGFDLSCKYCGLEGLKWIETPDGWRLRNVGGVIHECLKVPRSAPENDFSEVPDDDDYTKAARG